MTVARARRAARRTMYGREAFVRVLIADDAKVPRRRLEAMLGKWNYDVVVAADGAEAWQVLQAGNGPRLAVLDWMMPNMNGVEVCRKVRKRKEGDYIYILLLTSRGSTDDIVLGLEAGADDYIAKPFDAEELKARLRTGRRILELESALIEAREALRFQATHDALTSLWNRAAILGSLDKEVARADRAASPLAVAIADLDHFKTVNDSHGHQVGDDVLQETAKRLASSLRPYDEIGRYGGEEFLIIMPGCDDAAAKQVAERVRMAIEEEPAATRERPIPLTVSIGVATTVGGEPRNPAGLIKAADTALYRAKEKGRNRVEVGAS